MHLHLLLACADDHRPLLSQGLGLDSLLGELAHPSPVPASRYKKKRLYDPGGDPNDLKLQRWGLVAPEGERGDLLLSLVEPLACHRAAQQGLTRGQLVVLRAGPDMSQLELTDWVRKLQAMSEQDQPRYLLLLGDADELSFEFQQHLAGDRYVGRLTFPDEAGYKAYVEKVLRVESSSARGERARVLFFTVHDGTPATDIGYHALIQPGLKSCEVARRKGDFPASKVVELGTPERWSPMELGAVVAERTPGVLFTLSHGLGPPRSGWTNAEAQRRLQGAMSLGEHGELTAEAISERPFMPDGLWFAFSCFSAGTPARSAYAPWLQRLRDDGADGPSLSSLRGSAPLDHRSFVSALPQAALANPEGPLGVFGHVDLAWVYAFQELTGHNHASRFMGVLRELVKRRRAGVSLQALTRFIASINAELTLKYHEDEAARAEGASPPEEPYHRAHLWMTRNDLSGYILLGDPAVQLPG